MDLFTCGPRFKQHPSTLRHIGGKEGQCGEIHLPAAPTDTSTQTVETESVDHRRIQNTFRPASTLTLARRRQCPAHDNSWEQLLGPRNIILRHILKIVKIIVALLLILCPPWPPRVFRQIVFRAPRKGYYYHLIGGEVGNRSVFFSAQTAASARNLSIVLPHMQDSRIKAIDIFYHILRCKPVILKLDDDQNTHICVMELLCEQTIRWLSRNGQSRARSPVLVIFCQPNSSDMGSCMLMDPNFADMADFMRCDFLVFDYPGYGLSDGKPTETAIYKAIERVYRYAQEELGYHEKNIVLVGFSLGTAAAVHVASTTTQLGALVLVAPFTSFARVVLCKAEREAPIRFDMFRSYDAASKISCPTLICHGENDIIVDDRHGRAMYKRIRNCQMYLLKASHQGILCERKVWDRIEGFVREKMNIHVGWLSLVHDFPPRNEPEPEPMTLDELNSEPPKPPSPLATALSMTDDAIGIADSTPETPASRQSVAACSSDLVQEESVMDNVEDIKEYMTGTA